MIPSICTTTGEMSTARGELKFEFIHGKKTSPVQLMSSYPLRFLVAKRTSDSRVDCCWVYSMNYGGGLVGGDHVNVSCALGQGCTVVLTTQGSTKIYKTRAQSSGVEVKAISSSTSVSLGLGGQHQHHKPLQQQHGGQQGHRQTYQSLKATVARFATLALLPDPFTCFRGAIYHQVQEIDVQPGGNLLLVDWYTSGRMGRGESWEFARLESETRVTVGGQVLLWEPLLLENGPSDTSASRMGVFECFCLLVLVGPRLRGVMQTILETQGRPSFTSLTQLQQHGEAGRWSNCQNERIRKCVKHPRCISSVCRLVPDSTSPALALKVAGQATQDVHQLLSTLLEPLEDIVGCRPYRQS